MADPSAAFVARLDATQRAAYEALPSISRKLLVEILTGIPALSWGRALVFAQVFPLLAAMDSIHDFWPERERATSGQDADEDEEEVIDESRMAMARTRLVNAIQRFTGRTESTVSDLLAAMTGGAIRSATSNFEPNVEAFLKSKIPALNPQVSRISFDEILTKAPWTSTDSASWLVYQAAIKSLGDGLEIYPGDRRLKLMSESERNKIGFFLLAYLNPNQQPGTGPEPEFTFDAAPKDVDKILGGLNQTRNAIFPQNIADSASTSFSALRGRARYYPAHPPGQSEQIYRSNVYSMNKFRLSIEDGVSPFSSKNRFDFKLKAVRLPDGAFATAPFGVRATQGPSVNYLIDLLTRQRDAQPPGKVLSLSTLFTLMGEAGFDEDLLYDLKRSGDAEQVFRALIAKLMERMDITLVTIDRLCSVLARLLGLPTIFHTLKGFFVFRGEGGAALTPQENILRAAKFKAVELAEKLTILQTYSVPVSAATSAIRQMKVYIDTILPTCTVFSDPVALPPPGTLGTGWADRSNEYAGTFATALLRYRLMNISAQITALEVALVNAQNPSIPIPQQIAILRAVERLTPANVDPATGSIVDAGVDYSATLTAAEAFVARIGALNAFGLAIDITTTTQGTPTLTREPLYIELLQPGTRRLKRGVKSTFYKFSAAPFGELQIAVGKLLRENRGRLNEKSIITSLVEYFRARDVIKEDFFEIAIQVNGQPSTMKAVFEFMTDITTGMTPGESIGAALIPGKQTLLDAIRASLLEVPSAVVPPGGGGRPVQTGGATSPYQWIDLDDLLFEISDKAYGIYMSARTELGPDAWNPRNLTRYLDVFTPLVQELQSQWLQTIADLRLRASEEYPPIGGSPARFEETTTTDLLSYLLSYRTVNGTVMYDPLYATAQSGSLMIPDDMYGNQYARRDQVIYNDIARELLVDAMPEVKILHLLAMIRNAYEQGLLLTASPQWGALGSQLRDILIKFRNDLPATKAEKSGSEYNKERLELSKEKQKKGLPLTSSDYKRLQSSTRDDFQGRRSLYSNAGTLPSGGSRPGLYAGLRKRPEPRHTARVRQHTGGAQTRRQRLYLDRVRSSGSGHHGGNGDVLVQPQRNSLYAHRGGSVHADGVPKGTGDL